MNRKLWLQVIGQVEKLSHVTDNIQSKTEQVLALVNGLDLGEVLKSDGGKGKYISIIRIRISVVDPKWFFSDPDPTFQEIPDPTQQLLSKEAKVKCKNKTEAQVLILKKIYVKNAYLWIFVFLTVEYNW